MPRFFSSIVLSLRSPDCRVRPTEPASAAGVLHSQDRHSPEYGGMPLPRQRPMQKPGLTTNARNTYVRT